jgi:hypothetical protein
MRCSCNWTQAQSPDRSNGGKCSRTADFAASTTVVHTAGEYYRHKDGAGIQSAEAFFAILKRGVMGSFHSVSEQHLDRYVQEFAFRWNTRSALGIEDTERAGLAIKGAVGSRLTYKKPH